MADEPKNQPDDIKGILSELDAILSDLGTAAGPVSPKPAAPPPPKAAPPPPKPAAPAPASAPSPAASGDDKTQVLHVQGSGEPLPPIEETSAPKLPPITPVSAPAARPAPPPPRPAPPPAAAPAPVPPPAPVVAPVPSPTAAPAPVPAPISAVPAPVASVASSPGSATIGGGEVPVTTPKEQIRRVAFLYTFACAEPRRNFAVFLSQVAKTVSKKPLYLREVMSVEVAGASDPDALYEEAVRQKVVAILAIVEGWPPQRVDAMAELCSRAGLLFRSISPGDVQKKSAAVDVIVDMMLLPGERDG